MKAATTLALLAALAGTAHAEFFDGNRLLNRLQGEERRDAADFLQGLGYVTGVSDALRGVVHCPPDNITAGQISDMVKQYLVNNPEVRHQTGDRIVGFVLKRAWPCAERKGSGV